MNWKTNVDGKFERVSAFDGSHKKGPVVVAFAGNLTRETIRDESVEYIKWFYGRSGWKHRFTYEFPEGIEKRPGMPMGSLINEFMVIEE